MRPLFTHFAGVILLAAVCLPAGPLHAQQARNQETKKVISEGSRVSLEYTVNVVGGETVDSNAGDDPLVYTQGEHEIIPALEKALTGLSTGDEKEVTLEPEDAYGPVDPNAFQEVPLSQIPEEARKEGQLLIMQDQEGHQQQVRISEIRENTAVLNLNHPLAGKTLHFDVKVLDVE